MLYRPTENLQGSSFVEPLLSAHTQFSNSQYGLDLVHLHSEQQHLPRLLSIPSESLTHITAFLDPPSLLALARVCKVLYQHVQNDNVWHRAFICHFLGVSPETDLQHPFVQARSRLLRRSHKTWREEFISRYNLERRWEYSKISAMTYSPHQSSISDIYLMPGHQPPALLTSSLQYGVVSRSFPLTGRILKGYLDASGMGLGIGNNNPNIEFTPNVTASAMTGTNDYGTAAQIIWGFRDGEVALMLAQPAMATEGGGGRHAHPATMMRCRVQDAHEGAVLDAICGNNVHATAGADGRIKLWANWWWSFRCLWTSEKKRELVTDAVVKVAMGSDGVLAGAFSSGEIVIYTGFGFTSWRRDMVVREIRIPCLITPTPNASTEITTLQVSTLASLPVVLVAYKSHGHFYRIEVSSAGYQLTKFCEGSAPISCITTSLARPGYEAEEGSYVYVGDKLGSIHVYDWNSPSMDDTGHPKPTVTPMLTFHAHSLPITALSRGADSTVLLSGSWDGEVKVWNALSFAEVRTFSFPARGQADFGTADDGNEGADRRAVERIVATRDMFVASCGSKVLVWKAVKLYGGAFNNKRAAAGKAKWDRSNNSVKYYQRLDIQQAMADLRPELEQERTFLQRAYGREREQLGELNRLGLNEDEAVAYVLMLSRDEEKMRRCHVADEGVFDGDFDDVSQNLSREWAAERVLSCSPSGRGSGSSKVQLSPKPAEASPTQRTVSVSTAADFPPIRPTSSSSSSCLVSDRGDTWSKVVSRSISPAASTKSKKELSRKEDHEGDDDDDLRIAIELSLGEARERGHI